MPSGSTRLWGPGAVPGEWADVCGFLKPPDSMKSGKYDYTVRFPFATVPWVFVKKIKAVTMKYGCISHSRTFAGSMHREINMIRPYTPKEDPPRTIRNRHNHPYDLYALP